MDRFNSGTKNASHHQSTKLYKFIAIYLAEINCKKKYLFFSRNPEIWEENVILGLEKVFWPYLVTGLLGLVCAVGYLILGKEIQVLNVWIRIIETRIS